MRSICQPTRPTKGVDGNGVEILRYAARQSTPQNRPDTQRWLSQNASIPTAERANDVRTTTSRSVKSATALNAVRPSRPTRFARNAGITRDERSSSKKTARAFLRVRSTSDPGRILRIRPITGWVTGRPISLDDSNPARQPLPRGTR